MKKIIYYISAVFLILLFINTIKILVTDLNRITGFGFGYLVDEILLYILFFEIFLITRKRILKTKIVS